MSAFNSLLRKASSLLRISSLEASPQKHCQGGEVTFCKNNVCVHTPALRDNNSCHPGYLTICEQNDAVLGSTLVLTWIPNATLQKNPRTLENRTPESSPCRSSFSSQCPSPLPDEKSPFHISRSNLVISTSAREQEAPDSDHKSSENLSELASQTFLSLTNEDDRRSISSTISDMGSPREDLGSLESFSNSDHTEMTASTSSQVILGDTPDYERSELSADRAKHASDKLQQVSPSGLNGEMQSQSDSGIGPEEVIAALEKMICGLNDVPASSQEDCHNTEKVESSDSGLNSDLSKEKKCSMILELPDSLNADAEPVNPEPPPGINVFHGSPSKSGSSSTTATTSNRDPESSTSTPGETPPTSPREKVDTFLFVEGTAESLAHAHHLDFPDTTSANALSRRGSSCGVFSLDLSQMRSLKIFFSNEECTCGQLVIVNRERHYKILHFHCGGLDRLASVFEEYNFLSKSKNKTADNCPYDRHFSVCRPELSAAECHPEEGFYSVVDEQTWRVFMTDDGSIQDELKLRKEIFFGGLDPKLHKEVWPFLLHYYSFDSTFEERDQVRNDRYVEYQNIRRKRGQMSPVELDIFFRNIQCTVEKDVVRTDRNHPFFAGDDNPNIEIMKNILLNYGFYNPKIGYTQGMSDLLAPILAAIQDESESFWCFVGLMQNTIFVTCPKDFDMDINLNYLRELFRILNGKFYDHLIASDALELLFVHRWILLCFKREFPEADAMRMWSACWSHYHTDYFHLFICSAIIAIFGGDVIEQKLRAEEMVVHFTSLAMHMSGDLVLRKARGLLHQFRLLPRIPCVLSKLCERGGPGMWDGGHVPVIDCSGDHGDHSCPFGGQDPTLKML